MRTFFSLFSQSILYFVYCFRFGLSMVYINFNGMSMCCCISIFLHRTADQSCCCCYHFFPVICLIRCCNSDLISISVVCVCVWKRDSHRVSSDFRSLRNNWIRVSHRLMRERVVISIWNVRHQPKFPWLSFPSNRYVCDNWYVLCFRFQNTRLLSLTTRTDTRNTESSMLNGVNVRLMTRSEHWWTWILCT